jgi:membrane-associated phospholipid phosphatase
MELLRRYYMPLLVVATAVVILGIFQVQSWGWACLFVLVLALIGTKVDAKQITWGQFMPAGFLTLLVFFAIYKYAGPLWSSVVDWQLNNVRHAVQWNELFNRIPLNDGWIFRLWQPDWLTGYMQWVYLNGFTLSYWICVIRAFFAKDVKKLALYSLGGYLLQVPLILPFYNTILLQEVWYVQGTPDLLERGLTGEAAYTTAWNCFPSMHTSIAFAAIVLAMREKSRWYRWVIGIYCWSIIISTMYLKVHWVIDVIAGMLFAYGCVKLADVIVNRKWFTAFEEKFVGLAGWLERRPQLEVAAGKQSAEMAKK